MSLRDAASNGREGMSAAGWWLFRIFLAFLPAGLLLLFVVAVRPGSQVSSTAAPPTGTSSGNDTVDALAFVGVIAVVTAVLTVWHVRETNRFCTKHPLFRPPMPHMGGLAYTYVDLGTRPPRPAVLVRSARAAMGRGRRRGSAK